MNKTCKELRKRHLKKRKKEKGIWGICNEWFKAGFLNADLDSEYWSTVLTLFRGGTLQSSDSVPL